MIYQEQITRFWLGLICFPMSALFTPVSDDHPTDPLSESSRNRTALYRQIPETAPILSYTHSQKYTQYTSLNLSIQLDLHHELHMANTLTQESKCYQRVISIHFHLCGQTNCRSTESIEEESRSWDPSEFSLMLPDTHTHTLVILQMPAGYFNCPLFHVSVIKLSLTDLLHISCQRSDIWPRKKDYWKWYSIPNL